jgi:secreted trypsin-like serine protease
MQKKYKLQPTVCANFFEANIASAKIIVTSFNAQGDSGGPLVLKETDKKFTQVGVVSFGPSVCGEGPLGFSRVSSFLGWISDTAKVALRP